MQVYLEPYGRPSRERLQALVAEAKATNPLAPVTVVPPNAYAGIGLRRVLAGESGLLNVGFMAFARLAEQLGAPSMAAQGRRPLSAAAEMAVIRGVATELAGQGGPLGGVATHPTLHRSLQSTFQELVKLTESELDALAALDDLRQATVELFRSFRDQTKGYYGREDMAWAAAEAVRSGRGEPALRDLGGLVFFLLPKPSPAEIALLDALAGAAPCNLVVGRAGEADVDDAEGVWWESLGTATAAGSSADSTGVDAAPEAIVSAPDAREEVRQAVREMLRLAEDGVPFHRMAALYRRVDPYAFQLRMELGFGGIPVAGPDPSPLRDSASGRLFTGLLAVIEDDFGRASLMQWLADAPVWNAASNHSASGERQRWEALSREAGIVRGVEQWKDRLQKLTAELEKRLEPSEGRGELSEGQSRAYAERVASAKRLAAFVERLSEQAPPVNGSAWSAYAGWAKSALRDYAQGQRGWTEPQLDALRRIELALEELGKLDAVEAETTLARFRQALDHALSRPVGRSGATGTGVFVAGLGTATGMEFEAVWLLGMSEGDSPARASEDPLLPDAIRATLPKRTLPLRREEQLLERGSYLAALATGQRRRLSYSRVDPVQRRPQYPSPWLLEAASTLAGEPVTSDRLNGYGAPWMTVIESMEDALRLAERGRAADGHEYDVLALADWRRSGNRLRWHPLASGGAPLGRALAMERGRGSTELTAWDGYVGDIAPGSARLGGSLSQVMSPTRLETWATCPYRHFLGSVLRLAAWETPEEVLTISALERGNLIHGILEAFINEALAAGAPQPEQGWTAQDRERLREIAAERFADAEQRGVTGRRALWEVVQEDILQDLDRFLEDDARYRAAEGMLPLHAEYGFGFGSGDPVSLTLPGGAVQFRGYIDRVDASADGLRAVVMDYKTGNTYQYQKMKDDPLVAGKKLQLPVYALAVRERMLPNATLRAEYWFVSATGAAAHYPVDLDAIEATFRTTVLSIAEGVRGGVFPAVPGPNRNGEFENCRYCDFKRVCPANKQALWARKAGSQQAQAYARLGAPAGDEDDSEEEDVE
ncbi:MAG: PD-(D/E)XK nuclease family protein [Chloroflexi bacterium]|nr:PD-(D/E)XK nuclease family protein [Chloroflexota bacterium]